MSVHWTLLPRTYGEELLSFLIPRLRDHSRGEEAFSLPTEDLWLGLPRFEFRSHGLWKYTYNLRPELGLERKLRDYLEEGYKLPSLRGPTKCDKTVLLKTVLTDAVQDHEWLQPSDVAGHNALFEHRRALVQERQKRVALGAGSLAEIVHAHVDERNAVDARGSCAKSATIQPPPDPG